MRSKFAGSVNFTLPWYVFWILLCALPILIHNNYGFTSVVTIARLGFEPTLCEWWNLKNHSTQQQGSSPWIKPGSTEVRGRKRRNLIANLNDQNICISVMLLLSYILTLIPVESETLTDIVLDLTGVDLNMMKKEDLSVNKSYQERCLSALSIASSVSSEKPVRISLISELNTSIEKLHYFNSQGEKERRQGRKFQFLRCAWESPRKIFQGKPIMFNWS